MVFSANARVTKIVTGIILIIAGVLVFVFSRGDAPESQSLSADPQIEVIGQSVEGRQIDAYTYGGGETHLLFVGGMHGGYEWNSVILAYKMMDYLEANPGVVPESLKVSIIPSLNPDGVYEVVGIEGRFSVADALSDENSEGLGRFNANDVDLNRNFDCKWEPESTWRGNVVDAGSKPFSEPEAKALKDFILMNKPDAVIFWHSQSDAVYASECEDGILPGTLDIMNAYSDASGYKAVESFDAYSITGDAEGWLASIGIPAITVELSTHETIEWQKNLKGTEALFEYYKTKI